jgi:hypothetical protein
MIHVFSALPHIVLLEVTINMMKNCDRQNSEEMDQHFDPYLSGLIQILFSLKNFHFSCLIFRENPYLLRNLKTGRSFAVFLLSFLTKKPLWQYIRQYSIYVSVLCFLKTLKYRNSHLSILL